MAAGEIIQGVRWLRDATGRLVGYRNPVTDKDEDLSSAKNVTSGEWRAVPSLFRLRITGTGTVTMDSRDSLGNITLNTHGPVIVSGATDQIEFPYAGDNAVQIRVTLTGTATCEVI